MLKFKLPQRPIRPKELFPLPVESFPSPARPFPTHMGVMFTPRGFSSHPPHRVDSTLGAFSVTQFRLYQYHKVNITSPHHHTLQHLCILEFQANAFWFLKWIRGKKKNLVWSVFWWPWIQACAIILILFPFSHLCLLVSLTNAALLLWH